MATFVPCVEDQSTPGARRHLEPAQNILFRATRTAALSLTRSATLDSAGATSMGPTASVNAALEDAYHSLWQHRREVPEGLRREWFEVALTLLAQQRPAGHARGWWWWLVPTEEGSTAEADAVTTGEAAANSPSEEHREQSSPSPRKARSPRWKPWLLWEDAKRQQSFLTLRTESTKYVTDKGLHLKLEAMRPEDIRRLDGPAFCARVRLFLHCQDLEHTTTERPLRLTPPSAQHLHEFELYQAILRFLVLPSTVEHQAAPEAARLIARRQATVVSAVLRYRVLVEVCALRLLHTPRCTITWHLLLESLQYMHARSCAEADGTSSHSSQSAQWRVLVEAVMLYTSSYLLPYLTLRDRHVEGARGSFHAVNAAFFSAPQTQHGLWDSVCIQSTNAAAAAADRAPMLVSSVDMDAMAAVTMRAYVAGADGAVEGPGHLEACACACTDALEHVALSASREGLYTAVDLESLTAEPELGNAVLSVLQFRRAGATGQLDAAETGGEADMFVSGATRRVALQQFVRRFYGCAPADAFERGGVPRATE